MRAVVASENAGPSAVVLPGPRRRRQLKRVALIVESALAPRRRMLDGVARYIQEHDPWAIYLKPFGVEKFLDRWLGDWNGDGIIASIHDTSALKTKPGIPIVDLVGVMSQGGVPLVRTNDLAVGRAGAEHLVARGFKHFAFVEYEGERVFWSEQRRVGFEQVVRPHGGSCSIHRRPFIQSGGGPQQWEEHQREFAAWLQSLPKPVGIMTSTDLMGQQLLEACQRLDISVPAEVAVIGADDDDSICRIATPPLSSVVINDSQRGYEAAALLDRMMRGEPAPASPVYIEPAGVASRASTDVMAIDDKIVITALQFIRDNAAEPIGVSDVVEVVPVSRSVLERRFRRAMGRTINNEITRLRLNHAVELLTHTDMEIKQVAYKVGFASQAYMNTVFQKVLRTTPGSFRHKR